MMKLALRSFGNLVSLTILLVCIFAAFKLWEWSQFYLALAGGLIDKKLLDAMIDSPLSGMLYIYQIFSATDGLSRLGNYTLSWLSLVGSVGAGWMSLLGIRGVYTALVNELR